MSILRSLSYLIYSSIGALSYKSKRDILMCPPLTFSSIISVFKEAVKLFNEDNISRYSEVYNEKSLQLIVY